MEQQLRILLAEDYEEIRDLAAFFLEAILHAEVTKCKSGNEAIAVLKQHQNFDIIISDYNMPDGNGGELFSYMKSAQINLPFALLSSESPSNHHVFDGATNVGHINKPFTDVEIKKVISALLPNYGKSSPAPQAPKPVEVVNAIPEKLTPESLAQVAENDHDYVAVPIQLLRKMERMQTPLFLKINDGKYVKMSAEESIFNDAELKRFQQKKVTHLYIEKMTGLGFLSEYLKKIFSEELWNNADHCLDTECISANTDLLRNLSQELGWSQELADLAQKHVKKALIIIGQQPQLQDFLKRFQKIEHLGFADHCTLLTMVSSALAHRLGWTIDQADVKLTYASLMHDMTLSENQYANKKNFILAIPLPEYKDTKDVQDVLHHPEKAAAIVRDFQFVPPGTDILIEQHHERPKGKGFPKKLGSSQVHQLSAVLAVSEDFVDHYLENYPTQNPGDFFQKFKSIFDEDPYKTAFMGLAEMLGCKI